MVSQFSANRGCGDLAATPSLDPQRQPQRSVFLPILNFTQPAPAGPTKSQLDRQLLEGEATLSTEIHQTHAQCSNGLIISSRDDFQTAWTDTRVAQSDHVKMAAPASHDWFLREWFQTLGKKQRDLITGLGYAPQTANNLWHSTQPYRRDHVEQISAFLNIQPFELLMPPEEAMSLRRLRSAIAEVVRADPQPDDAAELRKTGTQG